MSWNFSFFLNSVLFGIALAMDAFSVSLSDGLCEPEMKAGRMNLIAGTYSFFQFIMPMIGWICVHTIVSLFVSFQDLIPWIALALLAYLGGDMIIGGTRGKTNLPDTGNSRKNFGRLILQGIATSIDALSVGFTIESLPLEMAFVESLIIAAMTDAICLAGLSIGKKFGTRLSDKASILGGVILIGIGVEIFVTNIF